jgi:predicted ester cyclase
VTIEDNKRLVERFIDEVLEQQRVDVLDELVARPMMASNIKGRFGEIGSVLSDVRYRIDHLVAEGDTVAVFCTLHGRHAGEFASPLLTIPPTGRDVMIEEAYRFRVVDGKIDMFVVVSDVIGLITQIAS